VFTNIRSSSVSAKRETGQLGFAFPQDNIAIQAAAEGF
jgi:hypothetical protein